MKSAIIGTLVSLLALATPAIGKEGGGKTARVSAVSQSWEQKDRNLGHVLEMISRAAAQRADIVCLAEQCVPTDGGQQAAAALGAISKAAGENKMYVVANLNEKEGGKLFSTSYLVGPDGKLVGKYRKSHRLPHEKIALGDELPVFDTRFGKVGLMIGSDHYWPEIPLVMSLKGAKLILWSHSPEAVPQAFPLDIKMRVRALDDHVTLVCSNYAGELPYLCSNYPGYTGGPLGCGYVVDRSGMTLANTGWHAGVAVAPVDLDRPKDIYFLTFTEDRKLFRYLTDPNLKPTAFKGKKRKIKVSIAQVISSHGPTPDPNSQFAKILDEAGRGNPDVILMAEFGFPTETPAAKTTFAMVAEKARKYNTYIIIGGLRDPAIPNKLGRATSWAYIWDRSGEVVGKYRISQYGLSKELPVFKTDFGVVGLILCGDIYSQEICRALTLQGAEIILCGSQSWGPNGLFNLWMQQARAIDNCVYMATAHFPFSDIGQRSYILDPYGYILAASQYMRDCVFSTEVDLDAGRIWFAPSEKPGTAGRKGYLAGYYPKTVPQKRTDLRAVLLAGRRPELYGPIVEQTLADRDTPEAVRAKMDSPRTD